MIILLYYLHVPWCYDICLDHEYMALLSILRLWHFRDHDWITVQSTFRLRHCSWSWLHGIAIYFEVMTFFLIMMTSLWNLHWGYDIFLDHDVAQWWHILTPILPILFQYCYKYCYSDSRNLWAVMRAGDLAL
jgi:hypothetical protein